jgi:hypothetical protein
MSKFVNVGKRRWKAIIVMTALFLVGIAIGAAGGQPAEGADVQKAVAPVAKTVTVEAKPVTVTETETVKKRVVKTKTVTETVTVAGESGGGGGGSGGGGASPGCHPSYEGECLDPSLYDYDCASGSGDGPGYVYGTVSVVGYDEYGLDADGDGYGCD